MSNLQSYVHDDAERGFGGQKDTDGCKREEVGKGFMINESRWGKELIGKTPSQGPRRVMSRI